MHAQARKAGLLGAWKRKLNPCRSDRVDLSALTIAAIDKQRWQVKLFFKWLKQNLMVKHFFGNSLNAVKPQIWVAVCVYLIALIAHKALGMDISLRNFLNLVEVNMFEKITLKQMVTNAIHNEEVEVLQLQDELF
jgi:IS4 transposase